MISRNFIIVFFSLLMGFIFGFYLNNLDLSSQEAAVLKNTHSDLNTAILIHEDITAEQVKEYFYQNPTNKEYMIFQCDLIGFIGVDYTNYQSWLGWLNAHDCEYLFSIY